VDCKSINVEKLLQWVRMDGKFYVDVKIGEEVVDEIFCSF
jgi:hypothetical protein